MRKRLFTILVLALALCAILSGSLAGIYRPVPVRLICLSPPEGLELPVGQGVEIRCRVEAHAPATVEFRIDDVPANSREVAPGSYAAMTWLPEQTGSHVLMIGVRIGNRETVLATRRVLVTPPGSPVRIQ